MSSLSPDIAGAKLPTILLVDDDEDLLLVLNMKLTSEGFNVITCLNAEGVFELIETTTPDIVMMDITMKGISGAGICRTLKNGDQTKHLPVLMFSANHNIVQITRECGADDYIRKPLDFRDFKGKVKELLN